MFFSMFLSSFFVRGPLPIPFSLYFLFVICSFVSHFVARIITKTYSLSLHFVCVFSCHFFSGSFNFSSSILVFRYCFLLFLVFCSFIGFCGFLSLIVCIFCTFGVVLIGISEFLSFASFLYSLVLVCCFRRTVLGFFEIFCSESFSFSQSILR